MIYVVLVLSLITISGCTKKSILNYSFDNYDFSMKSVESFDIQAVSLPQEKLIAKQISKTGYIDSLLISTIDLSQITLDKFTTLNKSTLESRFAAYKQKEDKEVSFVCKWKKIKWRLLTFYVQMQDEKIHFSQYVFEQNKAGYLMSISSENKNQIKFFGNAIEKINCR